MVERIFFNTLDLTVEQRDKLVDLFTKARQEAESTAYKQGFMFVVDLLQKSMKGFKQPKRRFNR